MQEGETAAADPRELGARRPDLGIKRRRGVVGGVRVVVVQPQQERPALESLEMAQPLVGDPVGARFGHRIAQRSQSEEKA